MNLKRKKLLAMTVTVSLIASTTMINNMSPTCIPEDPMYNLEKQLKKDQGKMKNKKGYLV